MEDFYAVLGVDKKSSQDKIKKAYRKLQMKYHPDKGGDPAMCKKINEAYGIIGDPEKRNKYDMAKNNPFAGLNNDFVNMFFRGGMNSGMHPGMRHGMRPGVPNMRPNVRIFSNGQEVNFGPRWRKPVPITKRITINLEQAYTGLSIPLEIERWCEEGNIKRVEREKIYVQIHAGVDDNEIMIIPNKGNIINENLKGDIKLFIHISNNTIFKRQGLNLVYKKQITLKEALTGFSFDLKHISGQTYVINNDNGKVITPSFKKVIKNMGMKRERKPPSPSVMGDLIIHFDIKFPEILNTEQIKKLKKIL